MATSKTTKAPAKKKTATQILAEVKRKTAANKSKSKKTEVTPVELKNHEHEQRLAAWEELQAERESFIAIWARKISATRSRMVDVNKQYRKIVYGLLQEAYEIYDAISRSEYEDDFYANLRGALHTRGIRFQGNTPDATLIIRFICGTDVSTKTVSEYSKALEAAKSDCVDANRFAEWLNQKTLTKVIEDYRANQKEIETPRERLARARRIILRLIEAREANPLLKFTKIEYDAQRMIGKRFGLCLMLGYTYRTFGRGGDGMNVDISLSMLIPPSLDMEIYIVDKLAKYIISDLELYEEQMNTLDEKLWADDLWDRLVSSCDAEVDKRNEHWSNRQQAALYEDQNEFLKMVKEKKKGK